MKFGTMNDNMNVGGNGNDIQWLKIGKNESKQVIVLSHINPKNVGEDVFEMGVDTLVYPAFKPYKQGFVFKDSEGENSYPTVPYIPEPEEEDEDSENWVDVMGLLGVREQIKPNYLLWVQDTEDGTVYLYNPPYSVIKSLNDTEESLTNSKKKKMLKGYVVNIKRTDGKKVEYSVNALTFEEQVDVSGVELPCDLREIPSIKALDTVEKQIAYFNNIKTSMMSYLGMTDESEWPFSEDNAVKAEFVS